MVIDFNQLKQIRDENKDKIIVAAIGSFDLFHYEHLRYLQDAKKLGDILIIIIKDDFLVSFKGKNRPIIELEQRIAILDELKCVDYIVVASKEIYEKNKKELDIDFDKNSLQWLYSFYSILKELKPNILYHENTSKFNFARNYVTKFGIKLIERKRTAIVSTSKIIKKIIKNKKKH